MFKNANASGNSAGDETNSEKVSNESVEDNEGEDIGSDVLLSQVDVSEYVKEIQEMEKKMDRSELEEGTMSATTLSKSHARRRDRTEESFLSHLAKLCKFVCVKMPIYLKHLSHI